MKYRPDIDGLRAISVLIVLFFHAGFTTIKSGFVGVDVFFVISGFLITGNIMRGLDAGKFSLATFYQRRFLRLSPVLVVLLIVCFGLATYFYLPEDFIRFVRSAKHTAIFNSNSYFAKTTGGYFDSNSSYLLLLHTWSLAIEWKWYFLLPLIMLVTYKVLPRKYIGYAVFVFFIVALVYSMSKSIGESGGERHYYSLASRMFELLMGSVLVFIPFERLKIKRGILSIIGILAILAIIAVALTKNVSLMFPNYYAVIVCGSAATLIIIGAIDPKNLASRILSLKVAVFIGLISYSLYIWHWPIFALIRYIGFEETWIVTWSALGLSILLGYLSWKFLEQTTRYALHFKFTTIFVSLFIIPALLTYTADVLTKKNEGYYGRFGESLTKIRDVNLQYFSQARTSCISYKGYDSEGNPMCNLGSTDPTSKKALLIGDSYANQLWDFMDVLGKDANVAFQSNTHSACLALPDIYLVNWLDVPNGLHQSCRQVTEEQYEKIQTKSYDYVVIGQVWSYYFVDNIVNHESDKRSIELGEKRFIKALDKAIQLIIDSGATPVLVDETYVDIKNAENRCFMRSLKLRRNSQDDCSVIIEPTENELKAAQILKDMSSKYPNMIIIDPKSIQCPNGKCIVEIDGVPIFRNAAHITDYSSYQFGLQYLKQFGNPFNVK